MADKYNKRYSAGEVLEAIFNDEDSLDEQFDCGSDVEMVPDSAESGNDSDLDAQISQIITNLDLQDQEDFEHANTTDFEAAKLPGMFIVANMNTLCVSQNFVVHIEYKNITLC